MSGTRGKWVGLAVLGLAGLGAFFGHDYRGLRLGLWHQSQHASLTETRNLLRAIDDWLDLMAELEPDPETGVYDFPETVDPGRDPFDRGRIAFHRGDFRTAIAELETAIERRGESEERLLWLAMATLRQGEAENCLTAPAGETEGLVAAHQGMCTLPLGRAHDRPAAARRAHELFARLLERYDADNALYRWLLNFSAMTVGEFPDGVSAEHRLPDGAFQDLFFGEHGRENVRRFAALRLVDRAAELGVDVFDAGRGVAVEDFDADGDLDLVTGGAFGSVRYYRNEAGERFSDRTAEVGLGGILQTSILTAADYDNDGWMDLFIARPFDRFRLYRNRGDGTFADVTVESGLAGAVAPGEIAATWVSAWGDVEGDGDLDLFLAQWAFKLPLVRGVMARPRMDSTLFINDGGRFSDGTARFGLRGFLRDKYFVGAAFGDVDGDGFPDLYLASPIRRTSVFLRNRGGERFEPARLGAPGDPGFTAAFVDVDHDGRLDLFHGSFGDARTGTAQAVFGDGLALRSGHSYLLRQGPDGRFDERHDLSLPMATMGAGYGDLDNDGCHDFYLGTGSPESWFILPNLMYLGERRGRECTPELVNVSNLFGLGTVQKGHGIVFFDFDGDGDQDVYSALGGMWPADRWPNQLWQNDSALSNRWVKIRLRGRRTNRFGLGARITVFARAADGAPIVRRATIDNGTGFGSGPYLAHIGLLDAVEIARVEVFWPGSGERRRYPARLDALHVLDEAGGQTVGRRADTAPERLGRERGT